MTVAFQPSFRCCARLLIRCRCCGSIAGRLLMCLWRSGYLATFMAIASRPSFSTLSIFARDGAWRFSFAPSLALVGMPADLSAVRQHMCCTTAQWLAACSWMHCLVVIWVPAWIIYASAHVRQFQHRRRTFQLCLVFVAARQHITIPSINMLLRMHAEKAVALHVFFCS